MILVWLSEVAILKQSCIKVALDFVSPENFNECINLSEEFRLLPKDHLAKVDKLEVSSSSSELSKILMSSLKAKVINFKFFQVKKMALHALMHDIRDFEKCTSSE